MAVLVYTENWDGKFKKASYELLTYAADLAQTMGVEAAAMTIGEVADDEINTLSAYGVSNFYHVNNPELKEFNSQAYTKAVAEVAQKVGATVVLFNNNFTGRSISPRLAVRLKAGVTSGVVGLPKSTNPFVVKKVIYTGKAFANMEITSDIKILTINQNSYEIKENAVTLNVEKISATVDAKDYETKVVGIDKITGKIPLTEAETIVSGGRGLKGPENWGMIEELAGLLNAGTACSRPVSDLHWRGHDEHVGQTGKVVRPNLYIAIGISGAIQHLAGVNSSKVLVAINNDADAPFFEAADYGIVGDAFEVVPKMIEAVKKLKGV